MPTARKQAAKPDWGKIVPEASMARVFERIEASRAALGRSQIDFAQAAGISPQQYTNWKAAATTPDTDARNRPSIEQGILLCRAYGLTLDFLFRGDLSGLPSELHSKIARRLLPKRSS